MKAHLYPYHKNNEFTSTLSLQEDLNDINENVNSIFNYNVITIKFRLLNRISDFGRKIKTRNDRKKAIVLEGKPAIFETPKPPEPAFVTINGKKYNRDTVIVVSLIAIVVLLVVIARISQEYNRKVEAQEEISLPQNY